MQWWLRVVGVFYVVQFVAMVVVRAPIAAVGPAGTLDLAAAGDPLARFAVDTWVIFGLEVLAIGLVLFAASFGRRPAELLVWLVIAIEVLRGPLADLYMLWRGYDVTVHVVWIVLHTIVIGTGLWVLRSRRTALS